MITNEYGQVFFSVDEITEYMYSDITNMINYLDDTAEIEKWNQHCKHFEIETVTQEPVLQTDVKQYHQILSQNWVTPEPYNSIDINKILIDRMELLEIATPEYTTYLTQEIEHWYTLFPQGPEDLWKFLHYMIETCKEHDIVTGVGRGSSVSSLVLYLLDVHCVDPVKYNLNYKEFLR